MHEAARHRLVAELAEASRRGARRIDCPRCGAPCLRGDDHDEMALTVTVDAEPLQHGLDEMLAHLDGRPTYNLLRDRSKRAKPGQHNLYYREPWHIDSPKPWGAVGTVHREHRCERTT